MRNPKSSLIPIRLVSDSMSKSLKENDAPEIKY